MLPYFSSDFGNASSIHSFGQRRAGRERARASWPPCWEPAAEIAFTGAARNRTIWRSLAPWGSYRERKHVITTNIEHSAVKNPCERCKARVEVSLSQ